jgi:thymidylate synthase (FAD)
MSYDILSNVPEKTIKCLDKGFVKLIDIMPRLAPEDQTTADYAIVQAARVSYGAGTKTVSEDRGLIRYLLRHQHTTPLEMIKFKFHVHLPIFLARQWIRHRTGSFNEVSGRYSVIKDEFYIPETDTIRNQSKTNKQGGDEQVDEEIASNFVADVLKFDTLAYQEYSEYLEDGISREQSRMILPLNIYTEWYWSIDLHNLLHFLALRCDSHAQWEIQVYGNAILELIKPVVPFAIEAWEDYHVMRGGMRFTRLEIDSLKAIYNELKTSGGSSYTAYNLNSDNKREQDEWETKLQKLGILLK